MFSRPISRLLLAAAVALSASTAVAQDAVELKISHYLPESHGFHRDFILPWAEELQKRTGGKVKVNVFAGPSAFGQVARQADQVRAGVVDIALGLRGIPRGRFPASSVIELPFLVQTADAGTRALWDLYKEGALGRDYDDFKVLVLYTHNGGLIHTKERPVREIGDLKGLRMRTPSDAVSQMLQALGASPVGMPPAEIYENLQKGVLDGLVTTWDLVGAIKLNEVLKYHTDARAYTAAFYFLMNKAKYESLPPDVKRAIDETTGDAMVPKFQAWWAKWDAQGKEDAVRRGNEIIAFGDEQRAQWRKALQPMIDAYLDGLKGQGVKDPQALYRRAQALVDQYE